MPKTSLSEESLAFLKRHAGLSIGSIEVFDAPGPRPGWPAWLVAFGTSPNGDGWALDARARPEPVVVVDPTADSLDDEGAVVGVCGSVAGLVALAARGAIPDSHFAASQGGAPHPVEVDPARERVIRDVLSVLGGDRDVLPRGSAGKVEALLEALGAPHARVLRLRLGLGEPEPYTPRQVARALGVDRDAAKRLEGEALDALRRLRGPTAVDGRR